MREHTVLLGRNALFGQRDLALLLCPRSHFYEDQSVFVKTNEVDFAFGAAGV